MQINEACKNSHLLIFTIFHGVGFCLYLFFNPVLSKQKKKTFVKNIF